MFAFSVTASAQKPTPLPAPHYAAGEMIELKTYEPGSQTFEIKSLKYPAHGPFYATLEDVVDSISSLNLERVRRSPRDFVKNQYLLDKNLFILDISELPERTKQLKNKASRKKSEEKTTIPFQQR